LVMKRFRPGDLDAPVEFENLAVVAPAAVATPEPVSLDRDGLWFGTPTLVMAALPGTPDFYPQDIGRWAVGAADALAAIHELDRGAARSVAPARWRRWRPETKGLGKDAARAEDALDDLYRVAAGSPTVLSHDDYNPGTVLFDEGRLSGGSTGPR
jgi:aminoglycoside phosphotransferase (APT) family kinase protein